MQDNKILYYTIAVFSTSKRGDSLISKKNLVASIQYRAFTKNFLEDVNWNSVIISNIQIRNSKDLNIYLINRNNEISEPEVSSLYQNWNEKEQRREVIELKQINNREFFTLNFIDEEIFDYKTDLTSKIFIFENTPWRILVNKFKSLDIGDEGKNR